MQFIKHRLTELGQRLKSQLADLRIVEEQLALLEDDAADANLRALVSETPLADAEAGEMQGQVDALTRERDHLLRSIEVIRSDQDALLDKLAAKASYPEEQ